MKVDFEDTTEYTVERVLDERTRNRYRQYLVKWEGFDLPEWQDAHTLIDSRGEPYLEVRNYLEGKRKDKVNRTKR